MRDTHTERERERQREKQAPCREPNVGLDPGTPGLHPWPKAGAKLLSHPGIPSSRFSLSRVGKARSILLKLGQSKASPVF